MLPGWKRAHEKLYDYEHLDYKPKLRLEIKKQANLQWFDVGKYHQLSEEDKKIFVLFVNHLNGEIQLLLLIQLGDLIDWLCSEDSYKKLGWNDEVFSRAFEFKDKYPALQFKVKLEVLGAYRKAPHRFEVLYEKS